jgi:hypothetical protein
MIALRRPTKLKIDPTSGAAKVKLAWKDDKSMPTIMLLNSKLSSI